MMMKRASIVFIAILFTSCNAQKNERTDAFLEAQNSLTRKLTKLSKQASFNGFGVALVNEKEVLYENGFGLANLKTHQKYDGNTIQNIASVSKTFIGLAVLKAQELGKLKLDDDVNKYLPFHVVNPYHPNVPLTIRQLTTHTSSIKDTTSYMERTIVLKDTTNLATDLKIDVSPTKFNPPEAKMSLEQFLYNILDQHGKWYSKDGFLTNKPGGRYNYSNVGASLAALVVEKATGMSYGQFTTKYILKPLNMNHSGWDFDEIDFSKYTQTFINKTTPYPYYSLNTYPDGGMLTSASDMSKYMLELLKGHFGKGTVLTTSGYKEYFTPQLSAKNFVNRSDSEFSDEYNMGITMGFGSTLNFGHTGGDPGLNSVIWFFKEKPMGRYFIVNTDWNNKTSGRDQKIIYDLLDEYYEILNALSDDTDSLN